MRIIDDDESARLEADAADDAARALTDLADVLRADNAAPWTVHQRAQQLLNIRKMVGLLEASGNTFITPAVAAVLTDLERSDP